MSVMSSKEQESAKQFLRREADSKNDENETETRRETQKMKDRIKKISLLER